MTPFVQHASADCASEVLATELERQGTVFCRCRVACNAGLDLFHSLYQRVSDGWVRPQQEGAMVQTSTNVQVESFGRLAMRF